MSLKWQGYPERAKAAGCFRCTYNGSSRMREEPTTCSAAPKRGSCGGKLWWRLALRKSERLGLVYARESVMHPRCDAR
jgi:hypothetical protein